MGAPGVGQFEVAINCPGAALLRPVCQVVAMVRTLQKNEIPFHFIIYKKDRISVFKLGKRYSRRQFQA
jgi:hypothetical protein